jgi:photosystem II stability/assembly factor-like uncharacterized protein
MFLIYLGTPDGIVALRHEAGRWQEIGHSLAGYDVWALAHPPGEPEVLFAGTYGQGLYRSTDAGERWDRVGPTEIDYVRAIAFAPGNAATVYIGTEPANVFRSIDGDAWADLGIRSLPGSDRWSLPYSPREGAVRTFALHRARPGFVYGGVEQGGVLVSADGGATWRITQDSVHPDVHHLAVHPGDPQVLFAATGGGLYRTRDWAQSWDRLLGDYNRAVAVHPLQPKIMFAGPARRVGHEGRILASQDGGESWILAARGLEIPMQDMVESFVLHPRLPDNIFAVLSNGDLYYSEIEPIHWRPFEPRIRKVKCLDILAR